MTDKKLEMLLVEDREDFVKAAKQVLEQKGYNITVAGNHEEAQKMRREKEYDITFIDGFFPLAEKFEEDKHQETATSYINKLPAAGVRIPFDYAIGAMLGNSLLPMGVFMAEDMKEAGENNYLIVSCADHHRDDFRYLSGYANAKGLNIFLKDMQADKAYSYKSTPEFWKEAIEYYQNNIEKKE